MITSKKTIYISRSYINDSPVGVRYRKFLEYLKENFDVTILNLTNNSFFFSRKGKVLTLLNTIISKIPLWPDSSVLILPKYKRAIKLILKDKTYKTIIIQVLPNSLLLLPKYIKSLDNKLNVIVDLSDPVTTHLSFKSFTSQKQKYLYKLEKNSMKYIDTLIVLNKEIKEYYERNYNLKTVVIEQGIDEDFTSSISLKNRNNKTSLIYAGQLYKGGREPYELYKAIEDFNSRVVLSVFGRFNKAFIPPKTDAFHYGGRLTRNELKKHYNYADIIVFIDNKNTIQVPGKALEVLALNKPILFIYYNQDSPTVEFFRDQPGIYYSEDNQFKIRSTIKKIIDDNCFWYDRNLEQYYWENILKRLSYLL